MENISFNLKLFVQFKTNILYKFCNGRRVMSLSVNGMINPPVHKVRILNVKLRTQGGLLCYFQYDTTTMAIFKGLKCQTLIELSQNMKPGNFLWHPRTQKFLNYMTRLHFRTLWRWYCPPMSASVRIGFVKFCVRVFMSSSIYVTCQYCSGFRTIWEHFW